MIQREGGREARKEEEREEEKGLIFGWTSPYSVFFYWSKIYQYLLKF